MVVLPDTFGAEPIMSSRTYAHHAESDERLRASIDDLFAYLDAHPRVAAHMQRPSWRMAWGRMTVRLDAQDGRAAGSRIRIDGRVLGLRLWVDEVVIERVPPTHKVWETVGVPRLLVIGPYRMGFALSANGQGEAGVMLSVFIDYDLPGRGFARLLGRLLGRWYARWCAEQMVADARTAFGDHVSR